MLKVCLFVQANQNSTGAKQLTHLNIDIQNENIDIQNNAREDIDSRYLFRRRLSVISKIFILILSLCKRLINLNFCQLFPNRQMSICIHDLSRTKCMSASLTKLKINVKYYDDCLYLLDGCLNCLSKLIINVENIGHTRNYTTMKKLPKLKHFLLSSIRKTYSYDKRIIPLLRRMINLEELTLFLLVVRFNSTVIDGIQLHDDILSHMPRLNKFTFSMNITLIKNDIEIDIALKEDIQRSFIGKEYGQIQIGSYVYSKPLSSVIEYHIYSFSYQFENFLRLNNSFQGGMFHTVRCLTMNDNTRSFEHQLFEVISQDFPFLKELIINNVRLQQNKQNSLSLIIFPHLIFLNLVEAHVDYAEQFLVDKNTHLPCLLDLLIAYEPLTMVTKNFTNDATRLTCAKLKRLHYDKLFVRSKSFHQYFPLLL